MWVTVKIFGLSKNFRASYLTSVHYFNAQRTSFPTANCMNF